MVEMAIASTERIFGTIRMSLPGNTSLRGDARTAANAGEVPPHDPRPGAEPTPPVPTGFWATLWRVAWLSILLGLLVQLALVLADIRLGRFGEARSLAGATARTVSWSVLVCTGIALGRAASKVRMPLMGVTGLLAAPVALNVANMLQRAIHEALDVANISPGVVPLWLMLIKAAEYGFLGAALGWIGGRAWAGALEHVGIGLITALFFGGVTLFLKVQAAAKPPREFVGQGINELLFPVGCALVVYAADVLGRQVRADEPRTSQ